MLKKNTTMITDNTLALWSLTLRGFLMFSGNYTIFPLPFTCILLKDYFPICTSNIIFLFFPFNWYLCSDFTETKTPTRSHYHLYPLTCVCACTLCLLACYQGWTILTLLLGPSRSWFFKLSSLAILSFLLQLQFLSLLLNYIH